jgi:signal transduction histidine kinase/CheY-like chemotaxis protein
MDALSDPSWKKIIRHEPRLLALQRSGLLDTPAERTFDRLTWLVRRVLKVPVALLSLVDADRQFFKSAIGLSEPWASRRETPLSHSFCQHVVASGAPLAVEDARAHPLVRDNPAVTDLGVVAYLGMPLAQPDGHVLGSLCAIDTAPRSWTAGEVDALRDLAELAKDEMVLRRLRDNLETQVEEEVARRDEAQAKRAKAERLAGLRQLAGRVAHDMNNILQAASGGIRLAARRLDRDPAMVRHLLDASLEAMDRGASVTRRLLSLAGRGVLFPEPLDVAALLAELREGLPPAPNGDINVHVDVPGDLPPMLADRAQLEATLKALAANARDVMPEGGTLALAAVAETVQESSSHRTGLRPGAYVRLDMSDTGPGMSATTLAHASEPFFTTKESGTGLGLATARSFAEQSGGRIAIASEPRGGTTVSLWLPQARGNDARAEVGHSREEVSPSQRRRILLVDDDLLVLRVFALQLAEAGHTVAAVGSAAEALAKLDAGETADLLVSDLTMPGMDGLELIREAQARRPGLPAVLITGDPAEVAALNDDDARAAAAFQLMHKPVSGAHLLDRITAMLEGK